MNEFVMSLKEKTTTQPWFSYFELPASTKNILRLTH